MKLGLVFILLYFSLILQAELPPYGSKMYKTFFVWNENRKLNWYDFQGKAIANASEAAMTASSIEFSYAVNGNQLTWLVTPKFYPKISWTKKNMQSDYVLKHEQLHFDITELYARLFRQRLFENVKSAKDIEKLKKISKQIIEEWQQEENDYDIETNHSIDEKKQAEWNLNVEERLINLKEFTSR
jgi:hypothetical protein